MSGEFFLVETSTCSPSLRITLVYHGVERFCNYIDKQRLWLTLDFITKICCLYLGRGFFLSFKCIQTKFGRNMQNLSYIANVKPN